MRINLPPRTILLAGHLAKVTVLSPCIGDTLVALFAAATLFSIAPPPGKRYRFQRFHSRHGLDLGRFRKNGLRLREDSGSSP